MRGRNLFGSLSVVVAVCALGGVAAAQVVAPQVQNVPIPPGVDAFNLSLDEIKKYSSVKGFEVLGHSYFKLDQRTPWAKGQGRPGGEVGAASTRCGSTTASRISVDIACRRRSITW
jgi:hypothetical protein